MNPTMVVRRGNVLIPLDRNPLETFLLELCVIAGVVGLTGVAPRPPGHHVPTWIDCGWFGLLLLGGLVGLVGSYLPDVILGVLIVRASMWAVGTGALLYAVSSVLGDDLTVDSAVRALTLALFAGHALWRAVQIPRHLKAENLTRVRFKAKRET